MFLPYFTFFFSGGASPVGQVVETLLHFDKVTLALLEETKHALAILEFDAAPLAILEESEHRLDPLVVNKSALALVNFDKVKG